MSIKQQLDADLKTALLAGDKQKVTVLRGLKSAILYAEVAQGVKDQGLDDSGIVVVLSKESKKLQDSADLYKQGGDENRAQRELSEKEIVDGYLPQQASDDELDRVVEEVIASLPEESRNMGAIIGQVKTKLGPAADGGRIAAKVRQKLG